MDKDKDENIDILEDNSELSNETNDCSDSESKDLVYELLLNVHFPKKMKVMLMLSKICMESF